jgi:hypothetical protein
MSRNGTAASERGLVGSEDCRYPEVWGAAILLYKLNLRYKIKLEREDSIE